MFVIFFIDQIYTVEIGACRSNGCCDDTKPKGPLHPCGCPHCPCNGPHIPHFCQEICFPSESSSCSSSTSYAEDNGEGSDGSSNQDVNNKGNGQAPSSRMNWLYLLAGAAVAATVVVAAVMRKRVGVFCF